eukprot:s4286_g1.t1
MNGAAALLFKPLHPLGYRFKKRSFRLLVSMDDEDLEYTLLNKRDVMEPASGSLHSELWGWWLLVQYV